jgi:hypothetical protein
VAAAFVALGLVLPALLLQDSWRYAFFANGQGRKAFLNDAVWAVSLVPAMLLAARDGSVFTFLLAWGRPGLSRRATDHADQGAARGPRDPPHG